MSRSAWSRCCSMTRWTPPDSYSRSRSATSPTVPIRKRLPRRWRYASGGSSEPERSARRRRRLRSSPSSRPTTHPVIIDSGSVFEPVVLPGKRDSLLGEQPVDDLGLLGEQFDARADLGEREAEPFVLAVHPPGAHADLDTATRSVVDGERVLRQHGGMPERHGR